MGKSLAGLVAMFTVGLLAWSVLMNEGSHCRYQDRWNNKKDNHTV